MLEARPGARVARGVQLGQDAGVAGQDDEHGDERAEGEPREGVRTGERRSS